MFVLWLVVIWISVVEISYLESVSVVVDYNDLDREVEKQCIEHCHLQVNITFFPNLTLFKP